MVDRNLCSADFRQLLIYCALNYCSHQYSIERVAVLLVLRLRGALERLNHLMHRLERGRMGHGEFRPFRTEMVFGRCEPRALRGALKGLRQDKGEENYLRVLMLHFGCGLSMRETATRAKEAGLADISPVALFKRLRKSREWLYELCRALFEERGVRPTVGMKHNLRLVDATIIKEPGPTGAQWRIHYSLSWPALRCDHIKLSPVEGEGTGESLRQFPMTPGQYLLADRGYCHASGIHYTAEHKSYLAVRLNPDGIALQTQAGESFNLLQKLKPIQRTGQVAVWSALVPFEQRAPLPVRICAIRKSKVAIALAHKQLRRKASKQGSELRPETLIYAEYVMVLTTFPEKEFPATLILEWDRFRWQVELVFKRFKQIAQLGHLPKQDVESSQAWLYGKLLVALLTDKVLAEARALSPWG